MSEKTVLLVEDDPTLRAVVSEALQLAGYNVLVARNGVEAHALVEAQRPHAIILDLLMPVAGGWELLQRLRRQGELAAIPVILYSGSANLEAEAARMGAVRWLHKPCPEDELLCAVHSVLAEEGSPAARTAPGEGQGSAVVDRGDAHPPSPAPACSPGVPRRLR